MFPIYKVLPEINKEKCNYILEWWAKILVDGRQENKFNSLEFIKICSISVMTKLSDSRVWQYNLKLWKNCCSVTMSCLTINPWTAACQAPLSSTISQNLLKFMSSESVMLSNHLSLFLPFFYLQSFPGLFDESLFAPGGQSIGASAAAPVLPMSIQGWFPFGLTSLISLLSKGLLRVCSSTIIWKHQSFSTQPCLWSNSHLYMTTGKIFDYTDLCQPSDISAF